ncbi:STAS domain-containing protein [Nakamurella leprariae]|uniref:Anti-sigma factor antagonist n=1 Tax=Nakamurella leprariae TaxID=2803911 RepID=A0A938Y688_9ACTN|nr:STAS domain-containing protein [Nakamurella leprariae]MBM9466801.1 STAS domain-containing protein [Nakamurella leprariae]
MTDYTISHPSPGAAVIAVTGTLNVVSARGFREAIGDAVDRAPGQRVVVDLAGVPTIDSSGLGALIGGLKAARAAGGDLRIAAANQQVITVLELTNLNRVLQPYPSVADGLGDAAGGPVAAESATAAGSAR